MRWLTENPWPLMVVLVGAAIVAGIMIERRGQLIGIVLLIIAGAVYMIEEKVVTTAEVVEREIEAMLAGFKSDKMESVYARISETAPNLKTTAKQGNEKVRLHDGFHLKDVRVTVSADGREAVAHLRANGRVTIRGAQFESQAATRWETTWKLEGQEWKLIGVRRLDVVSGDEIGVLDPG